MHAVVTHITVNDPEAAPIQMREDVVPAVSQSPGFVAGYWTRGDDGGMSMVVFESEDAAKALSERVPVAAYRRGHDQEHRGARGRSPRLILLDQGMPSKPPRCGLLLCARRSTAHTRKQN